MKVRTLAAVAASAGVFAGSAAAADPARLPASTAPVAANQTLADTIAATLTAAGTAAGADVTIIAQDGVVTLTGHVKSDAHRSAIVEGVRVVAGVAKVRDGLSVPTGVVPVQGVSGPVAAPVTIGSPPPMSFGPVGQDPVPLGAAGMGAGDGHAPPLPPYAWPTYAPHNNVSRVAYPQAYPYNAFPFIGPFYPFPKVPLGWRKVTLEWEDGHWWIGKTQAPQDYWRVRFW